MCVADSDDDFDLIQILYATGVSEFRTAQDIPVGSIRRCALLDIPLMRKMMLQRHHIASGRQPPPSSRRANPTACWRCGFAAGIAHPPRQQHPPQLLVLHAAPQQGGGLPLDSSAGPGSNVGSSGSSDSGGGRLEPGSGRPSTQQAEQQGEAPNSKQQQQAGGDEDREDVESKEFNIGVRYVCTRLDC